MLTYELTQKNPILAQFFRSMTANEKVRLSKLSHVLVVVRNFNFYTTRILLGAGTPGNSLLLVKLSNFKKSFSVVSIRVNRI